MAESISVRLAREAEERCQARRSTGEALGILVEHGREAEVMVQFDYSGGSHGSLTLYTTDVDTMVILAAAVKAHAADRLLREGKAEA